MGRRVTSVSIVSLLCLAGPAFAESAASSTPPHGDEVEKILVTGRPYGQSSLDSLQANSILTGEDLERRMQGSIGETLAGLPGISSSYFGPTASRPIIRGLSGDRVRMLIGGIGTIDASSISPDHAVASEPLMAERIEVLRGTGTLLYGSSAVGGVVNILDGRIPSKLPDGGIEGIVQGTYGTNADERALAAGATVGLGNIAVHAEGTYRKSNDFHIPGFAKSRLLRAEEAAAGEADANDPYGEQRNSDAETKDGSIGASYVGDKGFLGVSFARTEMNYGIPVEEAARIDMHQNRFDLMGQLDTPFLIFDSTKIRFGYADYQHQELEGDNVGTTFTNKGWEGRLELVQSPFGRLKGAMGVQASRRDFASFGEEAVSPPSLTNNRGIFAVEELDFSPLHIEFGGRFERQTVNATTLGLQRAFNTVSLSTGASYDLSENWLAGFTLSRSERAPNAEELYSNGPHIATRAFEIGNPDLTKETATTVEVVLRKQAGRVTGSLSLYHTWFRNFVYEAATGAEIDDLPVFQFSQANAKFYGGELELAFKAIEREGFSLTLDAAADLVRATLTATGEPLPRIPPKRLTLGATGKGDRYDVRVEMQLVDKQNRHGDFELPTDGYSLLNASFNYHPFADRNVTLSLQGRNLTNADARNSASFIKDLVPMPGRDIRCGVNYKF
ncbi:TonB-dependent receptor [Govanella unica]|uniref:TonB-dependent receptor n=1 Tax=Govanella unica TaxID=2975056 RepID=A0A9X3TYY8_9PROT|nr:TonB-dependent receptor [Govania unica]MDA5194556.1 TonB-dependent receptor [Govania unica]